MSVDDDATRKEELDREIALRIRQPNGPVACGVCHFCNTPLDHPGMRWCDADCRDDWQAAQRARAMRD